VEEGLEVPGILVETLSMTLALLETLGRKCQIEIDMLSCSRYASVLPRVTRSDMGFISERHFSLPPSIL
jgi:hypothetical protein